MKKKSNLMTLQYWRDGDWYVGHLVEVPGVMSQGKTLEKLQENIRDAYALVLSDNKQNLFRPRRSRSKSIPIVLVNA